MWGDNVPLILVKTLNERETNTTQQTTNQLTTELKEPPHLIFCNTQYRFLRVASIHIYILSMVQNEWRQELIFKTHHVISLFNSLRNDETFCRQWFFTSALVEIINAVFQLEEEYIVLESQQFKQSMSVLVSMKPDRFFGAAQHHFVIMFIFNILDS